MPQLYKFAKISKAGKRGLSLLYQAGWWMNADKSISRLHRRRGVPRIKISRGDDLE